MIKKNYTIVSAMLFGLVALLHLIRALLGWDVAIGDYMLPIERSWVVFGATICLTAWGIRGSKGYAVVSSLLFGLVALLHLYRALITQTVVTIDALHVPISASWAGFVISAAFSIWGLFSCRS